jgi:hypothetical protein
LLPFAMIVNFAGPASEARLDRIEGRNPTSGAGKSRLQLAVAALGIRKERIGDK